MNLSAPIVIFGAGNLGRRVTRTIRPVLFCDNNRALWGTEWDKIPIESPQTAVQRYPGATFIYAIWHPCRTETMADRMRQLKSLGASNVIPFSALFGDYGNALLPHFFWERPSYYVHHQQEIRQARELMDPEGRKEFDRQMRLRLGDPSDQVIDSGIQYFPDGVFPLGRNEIFIDCGAYDGDTIADFRRATGNHFSKIVAFEPDPENFAALRSALHGNPRVVLHPYATGSGRGIVRFTIDGTGSKISSVGTYEVEVITLDEILEEVAPTYIKMDIEGSEPATIEGGSKTIVRFRPKMAVCVYHAPDHLWSIPLQLAKLLPDSRFTLRTYVADGWDCVCYCIPR